MTFLTLRNTCIACLLILAFSAPALGGSHESGPPKQAIVLAAFGTSYPDALQAILNIRTRVENAYPDMPVKLSFTSNIIRKVWQKRQADTAWQHANPGVPADVLSVKTPLATIADLQNDGYTDITVQSLHIFAGEEFEDLKQLMIALDSIHTIKARHAPFSRLRLGRPAFGMPGETYPYTEDIATAVKVLKVDVDEARKMQAALVYMGHGNDFFSSGIYLELQKQMNDAYDVPIFAGCVEGFPSFADALKGLKVSGVKKILLKPLMIVAGDHAANDMAGAEADSWQSMLTKAGYTVTPQLRGLGTIDAWADIYVSHIKDAMAQPAMLP